MDKTTIVFLDWITPQHQCVNGEIIYHISTEQELSDPKHSPTAILKLRCRARVSYFTYIIRTIDGNFELADFQNKRERHGNATRLIISGRPIPLTVKLKKMMRRAMRASNKP